MKLKRNKWAYKMVCNFVIPYLDFRHNIECSGSENIPKEGSALLMPKHERYVDIVFEGYFLKKYCNREGNWVMRHGLPNQLNYIGGMPVVRPMDIYKIKEKDRKKANKLIRWGRKNKQKIDGYIEWLFIKGEIVVVHPEGTRVKRKLGLFRREFFIFTKEVEDKYNIKIPVIPIGLEYKSNNFYLRAGKALDVKNPDIETIVRQEIERLSNL